MLKRPSFISYYLETSLVQPWVFSKYCGAQCQISWYCDTVFEPFFFNIALQPKTLTPSVTAHYHNHNDNLVKHNYLTCISLKQPLIKMYLVLLLKTKASRFRFEALKNKDFMKVSANIFASSCQPILQKHPSIRKGEALKCQAANVFFFKYRLFKYL